MLKIIGKFVFCLVFGGALGAQQGPNSVLLFPGIETLITPQYEEADGTVSYGPQQDGLTMPMDTQVARTRQFVTKRLGGTPNQVLVGHSQGGLRAMGYYHNPALTSSERSRIKSIITIGSPIRGFSPLANGNVSLRNKLTGILDPLLRGIPAALLLRDFPEIPGNPNAGTTQRFFHFVTSDPMVQNVITDTKAKESLKSLAELPVVEMLGLDEAGLTANYPALRDLSPNSAFIQNATKIENRPVVRRVFKSAVSKDYLHPVSFLLGFPIMIDRKIPLGTRGSTFTELKNGQYITYDLVTVMEPVATATLPSTVRIGHVVGTEASAIRMLGHSRGEDMDEFNQNFMLGITAYGLAMWNQGAIHHANSFALASMAYGLMWGWDPTTWASAIQLMTLSNHILASSNACFRARDRALNLVTMLNNDFYGSPQHDGFIPVSDQSLARNQGTSHMLGGSRGLIDKLGNARYEIQLPINHSVEKTDPEIWGPEGRIHTGDMSWGTIPKIQAGRITEGGILFRSARAALGGQRPPEYNPHLAEYASDSDNHFIW